MRTRFIVLALLLSATASAAPPDEVITGPEPKNLCLPIDDDTMLACGDGKCDARDTVPAACPADCKKPSLRPYNSLSLCTKVQTVHAPSTIAEVQRIVAAAARAKRSVRVVSSRKDDWVADRYAHTANDQICTDGDLISTENLTKIHGPPKEFEGQDTIEVDPGVTMHSLAEYLRTVDRSLGYAVFGFREATIAGAAATGSHGSSPKHPTVVASRVVGMTVVTSDGRVRELSERTTDADTWKALRANLGYLGVVVRLRLRVDPAFNLEVSMTTYRGTNELFKDPFKLVEGCDWGQIMWFPQATAPALGHVFVMCGRKTDKPVVEGAESRLFKPDVKEGTAKFGVEQMQHVACKKGNLCTLEFANAEIMMNKPSFEKMTYKGYGKFTTVVGIPHRMMSSDLPPRQPIPQQRDWELAIPKKHAKAVLQEAFKWFKRDKICLPLVGVFLRFSIVEDTTLLAHTVAQGDFVKGEPMMFFEMPVYSPRCMRCPDMARYEKPYSDFAERLVKDFGARPHWAKNRRSLFVYQKDRGYPQYGDHLERFRKVVGELDPTGMFANQFGIDALGLRWPNRSTPVPPDSAERSCVEANVALPPNEKGCPIRWERDGALCYPPCRDGYNGIGPVCWSKTCPAEHHDDGLTCRRDVDIDAKEHYGRGAGYVEWKRDACEHDNPGGCEKNGLMWYPKCRAGFEAVGCCICRRRGCPAGYKDDGGTCRRDAHIVPKESYGRGVGEVPRF